MASINPLFSADAAEEYFSTLLTYYRNTGNDIFKRDNEGRHVSDQIYSAEYQKYLGMQLAMREVLEYFAKFELGDTALRQQEHFRDLTKMVEPLTLDELRRMDGEPVWCEIYIKGQSPFYGIVHGENVTGFIPGDDKPSNLAITNVGAYGLAWLAYRQKPEEDGNA